MNQICAISSDIVRKCYKQTTLYQSNMASSNTSKAWEFEDYLKINDLKSG